MLKLKKEVRVKEYELVGKTFSISDLQSSIRQRESEGAKSLIQQLQKEKAEKSSNSVALTAIDAIKHSYKYLLKRHPSFSHVPDSLFEESYNDALLNIYERIDKFDSTKSSLNTWIDKMMRWAFLSNYRTWTSDKQNLSSNSIDDPENNSWIAFIETFNDDMERSSWQDEILVQAFENLSERDRNLIHYAARGLTPTQMVEEGYVTGASINAVRVALHAARKKFKNNLSSSGWDM